MSIQLESLKKVFNVPGGEETAVDGISLEVGEEEFVTLVGPSGCGKSTTLRCIAGLEEPTSGSVIINGTDVTELPPNRRNIAMMFQDIALYPHMTIRDNIAYPLKVRHVSKEERYEKAAEAGQLLQIPELLEKYPGELSGGQQQRAALARTIVQEPAAFLMDEPLSDLDANLKVEIRKEIQKIHKRVSKPTVYVTHDQEEALTMSDRVVVMNDGRIEQVAAPYDLYYHPDNLFVAEFIGNPNMNLVECELDRNTGKLELGSTTIEIPPESVTQDRGAGTTVGFRPEALRLGNEAERVDFEATVMLIEQTGNQLVATLDTEFGELRSITSTENQFSEGDTIPASIDKNRLHLFDTETGENISKKEKLVSQ